MRRQRNTLIAAIIAIPATVLIFMFVLWSHTSHRGLVVWGAVAFANIFAHWGIHLRLPVEEVTIWRLTAAHIMGGLSWATMTVFAMPVAPEWQAMVGSIMLAVLASGLVFNAQFAVPFAAWVLSISITAAVAFLRLDTELGNALAIMMAVSAVFALALGAVLRAGDLGASVVAARNADLVQELQVEKQQLRKLATTDVLTGTKNRLAFKQDLTAALVDSDALAIALIDLDDFKHINDSLGHHTGDQVLQIVARRIERALTSAETLYRIGGDELTVIQHRGADSELVTELGERLTAVFVDPITNVRRPLAVQASIGIADALGAADYASLLRAADEALYRAKRSPQLQVEYFDNAMRIESARSAALRTSVSNALVAGEIVPWLQPVVHIRTGRIVGAEALARWEHPDGVRSAAAFIDAIEESGSAPALDCQVFEAVCDYRRDLTALHGSEFPISINISPAFLRQFLDSYEDSGELQGAIIEITEQRDLTNHAHLTRLIERVQNAGSLVVVDDFGTGFSSMERLSLGSFDGLKIDGNFVQTLTQRKNSVAIVASIAEIGRQLRVPVVAEGIESSNHANRLLDFGVDLGQGYLYSPAMPVDDLAAIIERQRTHGPYFAHLAASQREPEFHRR